MRSARLVALSCLGLSAAVLTQEAQATITAEPDVAFTDLRVGGCFQAWLSQWWEVFGVHIDDGPYLLYTSWDDGQNDTDHDDMLLLYPDGTGLRTLTWTVSDDIALEELEVVWHADWEKLAPRTYALAFHCKSAGYRVDGEADMTGCEDIDKHLDESLSFSAECVSTDAGAAIVCDERGGEFVYNRADGT